MAWGKKKKKELAQDFLSEYDKNKNKQKMYNGDMRCVSEGMMVYAWGKIVVEENNLWTVEKVTEMEKVN